MLNAKEDLSDFTFLVSDGAAVGGLFVHTCLGVESSKFDALPVFEHSDERIEGPPSLQHAIVAECLSRADAEMYQPDAGSRVIGALGGREAIVASAAESFTQYLVYLVAGMPNDFLGIMSRGTAQAYEKAEASAPLHMVNSRAAGHELKVPLDTRVSLHDARALRKLLEASDAGFAVIADNRQILGLGSVSSNAGSLDVEVRGKLDWTLSAQGKTLLRSYAGQVTFPQKPTEIGDLEVLASRTVGAGNLERIWQYVEAARNSGHGMMLVVSSEAEAEVRRLGPEAFVMEPRVLEDSEVQRLGAVDGALLIDTEGRCHAFGIVLDGEAIGKGNRARGSRFNSAVRYQRAHSDRAFVVVLSVDGGLDLVPALRPQVSRSEAEAAVDHFCDLCAQDDPDGEDYAEAHGRVEDLAFYFDAEQCERVNQADKKEQERRFEAGGISTRQPPFRPDPEMNDSYFLPDDQDPR